MTAPEKAWKTVLRTIPKASWNATVDLGKTNPWSTWFLTFFQTLQDAVADRTDEDRMVIAEGVGQASPEEIRRELEALGLASEDMRKALSAGLQHYFSILNAQQGRLFDIREALFELNHQVHGLPEEIRAALQYDLEAAKAEMHLRFDEIPHLFDQALRERQTQTELQFEKEYLEQISFRYRNVSSPGVRDLKEVRQKLSIAYVSLKIKVGKDASSGAHRLGAKRLLSDHPHITLRGPAGSGKTTLLSWIALACASDEADKRHWQGGIPFIVRLRELDKESNGEPDVAGLVAHTINAKLWSKQPPADWIVNVMRQKRAIVMIDGIDELGSSMRPALWRWVRDFSETYKGNRIIVTSRFLPENRKEDWQPPESFANAELDEMTDDDILQFSDNWHDAILKAEMNDEDRLALEEAKETLPSKLNDPVNRRVRDLCATPLMCAMVCTLHWKEEGYLPAHRLELYERCCDMLIGERDRKRGIDPPDPPLCYITAQDKEMFLQQLAFFMVKDARDEECAADCGDGGYKIEISRERALNQIERSIRLLPDARTREATPGAVLDLLIVRTSLLREPVPGMIDFQHRSFQEYFAACAAGAADAVGELVGMVHDDQWHETIVLSAGTRFGGVPFGNRLIEALLKQGKRKFYQFRDPVELRHTCKALAISCLETAKQPSEDLRNRVLENLPDIIPPRSLQTSKAVAAAGEGALDHLAWEAVKHHPADVVTACARAVRLIGGETAGAMLSKQYSHDRRAAVLTEVCRDQRIDPLDCPAVVDHVTGGDSFKGQPFSEKHAIIRSIKDLSLLEGHSGIEKLSLEWSDKLTDLSPLSDLIELKELSLHLSIVMDLTPLMKCTKLKKLELRRGNAITNLDFLSELKGLESLELSHFQNIYDIAPVAGLTGLKDISLWYCENIWDLSPLSGLTGLLHLCIWSGRHAYDLKPLSALTGLRRLSLDCVSEAPDLSPLIGLDPGLSIYLYGTADQNIPPELESRISRSRTAGLGKKLARFMRLAD